MPPVLVPHHVQAVESNQIYHSSLDNRFRPGNTSSPTIRCDLYDRRCEDCQRVQCQMAVYRTRLRNIRIRLLRRSYDSHNRALYIDRDQIEDFAVVEASEEVFAEQSSRAKRQREELQERSLAKQSHQNVR